VGKSPNKKEVRFLTLPKDGNKSKPFAKTKVLVPK